MSTSLRSAILLVLFLVGGARAQSADEILKLSDQAFNNYTDLTIESKMTIYEPGAATGREATLITLRKGDRQLVRFTAPADARGMALLTEGRDTMYAYLPAFGRVRRMGTHAKNQSFMGSDVRNDDLASTGYSGVWAPKLVGTDGGSWILELTLLPGKEGEFRRQKIWVDKTMHQVVKAEFYDDQGTPALVQNLTGWKIDEGCVPGPKAHWSPARVEYVDHRRNDHRTVVEQSRTRANTGIGDDVFTQRNLLRGQ
jgi:outer membrane lipoprotein-sorting protein